MLVGGTRDGIDEGGFSKVRHHCCVVCIRMVCIQCSEPSWCDEEGKKEDHAGLSAYSSCPK